MLLPTLSPWTLSAQTPQSRASGKIKADHSSPNQDQGPQRHLLSQPLHVRREGRRPGGGRRLGPQTRAWTMDSIPNKTRVCMVLSTNISAILRSRCRAHMKALVLSELVFEVMETVCRHMTMDEWMHGTESDEMGCGGGVGLAVLWSHSVLAAALSSGKTLPQEADKGTLKTCSPSSSHRCGLLIPTSPSPSCTGSDAGRDSHLGSSARYKPWEPSSWGGSHGRAITKTVT